MNICIFTTTLDKTGGGPARSVPVLAKGLQSIGVNVVLLTFQSPDMNLHILDDSGVKLVVLPRSSGIGEIESIIKDNQIDLIHCQGIWLPFYNKVCRMALRLGIPYIMTPRGALEPWCLRSENKWKRIKKKVAMSLYQRRDLQKASMILATAHMEANHLRDLGLTSPIAVIPNGIIIDDYPCRPSSSLSKCKKQIIFLSRIVQKKGIELLLEAWKSVSKSHSDWSIIIVGNGTAEYISELNSRIQEYGIESSVCILPPAFGDSKYNLYIESSLFVLPTYSENFGMVIAEALSCGLPVITTTGTPWESLQKTNTGWWIDLSVENLIKTLNDALCLPMEELFEMGQRGSVMVRTEYDYISVAKRVAQAYLWILGEAEKPSFVL